MSRYYRIEIGGDVPAVYTSFVNGKTDPGALLVELDIVSYPCAVPAGNAMVRIWGISLQTISQSHDFNGAPIKVYAGMQKGLPLANPAQAGLIAQGIIYQAFGNWIGTAQTLDLILQVDGGATIGNPSNLTFNWPKGTHMGDAIKNALSVGFPAYTVTVNIDPKLVLPYAETGYYQTIEQFAQAVKVISSNIIGGDYQGVNMLVTENTISVYDGSTTTTPIELDFKDFIGQPTWIAPNEIQFNTVMRADVSVGSYIKFPPQAVTTTAQSLPSFRDKSVFQGVFQIGFVRHVGNSRQPEAQAWISTFNCYPAVVSSPQ